MGTLYLVWWEERRRFADAELAVLQTVGQQTGTLVRSVRLHEATERQARQATKLYEVAGQLASTLDVDRLQRSAVAESASTTRTRLSGIRHELPSSCIVCTECSDRPPPVSGDRAPRAEGSSFPLSVVGSDSGGPPPPRRGAPRLVDYAISTTR